MKITTASAAVNPSDELLVCFDVSKRSLTLFTQHNEGGHVLRLEDEIPNSTGTIEHLLRRCEGFAADLDLEGLKVLCEPTGGYERKLLQTARRLGHRTALVNPEHIAKLKTVESNDTGKTDHKDPRVMHLIARLGKTQTHRLLPEMYRRLRRLTAYYDEDEDLLTATRQRVLSLVGELFPDYDKPAAFTFGTTGAALFDAYGFDPYAICRTGYTHFRKKMKRRARYCRFQTLEVLFDQARQSARYRKSEAEVEGLVRRLRALWDDYERVRKRRQTLREEIEHLGDELKEAQALPQIDHLKGVTLFNLARTLGETGPLKDFPSKRSLLRYAGLNIRERQSGTYRGKDRISKKGRPLLRKILGQATFPLLRRRHLYGPYYHRKRAEGMAAQKAKVAVMRKFLGVLYALVKSGAPFNRQRFGTCESQYQQMAA